MKKQMLFLAIALFALAGFAKASPEAPTVLWVSECVDEVDPHDQGFIDLLEGDGYTVTRMLAPRDMTAAKRDEANTYDLVIVGRHAISGAYDDTTPDGEEETLWNSITAPMINCSGYLTRNSRWKWFTGGNSNTTAPLTAVIPDDPVFAGVTLDENNALDFVDYNTNLPTPTSAGNETLVAVRTVAGGEWPYIARFEAGVEYYDGAGQYAGGPRMALHCGRSGGGDGTLNLTAQGQLIFLNAVYDMSGATFDRAPMANAGLDLIANVDAAVQLDATAFDFEGAATVTWVQIEGPSTAVISDTAIEDPTVTCDTKGAYTLQISVDDGVNPVATDTVTVYVRDPADNTMLAHWDFAVDPNTLLDVTGNGFDGTWISTTGDPNLTTGILDGGTSVAFDGSYQDGHWEITDLASDPNLSSLATGNTFAAWIKLPSVAPAGATGYPVIAAFGDSDRLQVRNNGVVNHLGPGSSEVRSTRDVRDDAWHHVVGVFDGANSRLAVYVDGVLEGETEAGAGLFDTTGGLRVGNRIAARYFYGDIDDLQIYNYPLNDAEIAALTDAGDVPLYITAGEDQLINFKNKPIQLAGVGIVDDGKPVAASYLWELTAYPLGVDPNNIIINNPTALDATVTFPNPPIEGGYIFTLTGNDTVTVEVDTVQITIVIPTCADVIADGLTSPWDLVGGPLDAEGNPTPDCRVDLQDLAAFAAQWLECVDPADPSCTSPY